MASSISSSSLYNRKLGSLRSIEQMDMTGKVHVVRTVLISSGAAPSALTLFTVGANETFLLTDVMYFPIDASDNVLVYDNSGNSASGTNPLLISGYDYLQNMQLKVPLVFEKGITVPALTANKYYYFMFQGYLV